MCCGGYDRIVTDAQVARRLDVRREDVAELARREDFPRPLGRIEHAPLWRWKDVQRWARQTSVRPT